MSRVGEPSGTAVLVIEDDPAMRSLLQIGLRYEGLDVRIAATGHEGLRAALDEPPDLVILDWMLPGLDGLDVCRRLRKASDAPIIILTARDAVLDRVAGLDAGADDYLVKPFDLAELLARVRARLRGRSAALGGQLLTFGELALDLGRHEARRGRRLLALTATEFRLLAHFLHHPEQVLSKEAILAAVWGYDGPAYANLVEQYVRSLRAKLGEPRLIHTMRLVGYVLREHPP